MSQNWKIVSNFWLIFNHCKSEEWKWHYRDMSLSFSLPAAMIDNWLDIHDRTKVHQDLEDPSICIPESGWSISQRSVQCPGGGGKHSPRYCFGRGGKGRRHWAGVGPAVPSVTEGTYCSLSGEPAVTGGEAKESRQNWRTAFPNVLLRILPRGLPTDLWEYPLNLPAPPPPTLCFSTGFVSFFGHTVRTLAVSSGKRN